MNDRALSPFHRAHGGAPLVWGHRGASSRAPENTLAAFALALDEGADGLELDVRLAGTGEVVVLHDPTLFRLTTKDVVVRKTALAALRGYDLGRGERVAVLEQVMDLARDRGALLNVELKGDDVDHVALVRAVLSVLSRRSAAECARVMISSFYVGIHASLVALRAKVPIALLADRRHALPLRRAFRTAGVHPQHKLVSARDVAFFHAEKRFVNVWTVDRAEDVRRARELGVDGIITNDVRGTRAVLGL